MSTRAYLRGSTLLQWIFTPVSSSSPCPTCSVGSRGVMPTSSGPTCGPASTVAHGSRSCEGSRARSMPPAREERRRAAQEPPGRRDSSPGAPAPRGPSRLGVVLASAVLVLGFAFWNLHLRTSADAYLTVAEDRGAILRDLAVGTLIDDPVVRSDLGPRGGHRCARRARDRRRRSAGIRRAAGRLALPRSVRARSRPSCSPSDRARPRRSRCASRAAPRAPSSSRENAVCCPPAAPVGPRSCGSRYLSRSRARSSVGERCLHTAEVRGSIPLVPTPGRGSAALESGPVLRILVEVVESIDRQSPPHSARSSRARRCA